MIGDLLVSLLLPLIDQIVSEFGTFIFLSDVTKPLSIRYPSSIFLGPNKVILSSLSRFTLYFLKVKSSIDAPFKDIEPMILSFSNWILSDWFNASSREILIAVSFCSKLGVSELCSIFFFSTTFLSNAVCSGTKNN